MILILLLTITYSNNVLAEQNFDQKTFGTTLICSDTVSEKKLTNIIDIVEHLGLIYELRNLDSLIDLSHESYNLVIIVDPENMLELLQERWIISALDSGVDAIWIGKGIGGRDNITLPKAFGIKYVSEGRANEFGITYLNNGQTESKIFSEDITEIRLLDASAIAYFNNDKNVKLYAAETFYQKNNDSGKAFLFCYEAYSWWRADQESPWMRTMELYQAIFNCISDGFSASLSAYPRNMKMAFICRIEDVTPFHTSAQWLERANDYLDYYSLRNAPLTISLIPFYVDPKQNVSVGLSASSTIDLRQWINRTMERRGGIVQHGYTHQRGNSRSGVASELFDDRYNFWLSMAEQQKIIELGKEEINESLKIEMKAFEAPHYKANDDTYNALTLSDFKYTTHDENTPFIHRYVTGKNIGDPQETFLINIPETLGYIPLDPTENYEIEFMERIDEMYKIGGVAQFFDHLYDDDASRIGKALLDYSITKEGVWYTTVNDLGEFWKQRWNAYEQFTISEDQNIKVTLGKSSEAGLTLKISGIDTIKKVKVNGESWNLFGSNYIILPKLPETLNTIEIEKSTSDYKNEVNVKSTFTIIFSIIAASLLSERSFKDFKQGRDNRKKLA